MKKLKLNDQVTYNGHQCIVWGLHPNGDDVVLFNLATRNYITVKRSELN